MSLGWVVIVETPAGQGRVVHQQFLAHFKNPKIAEAEVRKFRAAPETAKIRAQLPIASSEMARRNIPRGEYGLYYSTCRPPLKPPETALDYL